MAKKFGKFLLTTATLGALAAGAYYFFSKKEAGMDDEFDETLRKSYYGGFSKNGVYYVVAADNIDADAFADIIAALYQG